MRARTWLTGVGRGMTERLFARRLSVVGSVRIAGAISTVVDLLERYPVTTWIVRHNDDLYIRSVDGHDVGWFRGAQVRHEGHIQAAGWRCRSATSHLSAATATQTDRSPSRPPVNTDRRSFVSFMTRRICLI